MNVDDRTFASAAALFAAARDGDRQAFQDLVAALSPMLWHVARSQGLDRETSQDVVQTAWLSLVRDLRQIRNPVALAGWLITTTKRECWRVRDRRRAEVVTADELDRPDPAPGPEELAGLDDQKRRLWDAVARLDQRCRELLRYVAFVPRPDYAMIAEALGMKHGSVGPTRARCLDKLHGQLRGGTS
ncbi:RNA polymerase sigma factor [Lentzea alba]|nr:sigma-70 family RNA polymerase sigma factor [Lentzea alba]